MAAENTKKEVQDVQVNVGKDLSTATLNGTKIEISPEGNVVVFTNEAVQMQPSVTLDKQSRDGKEDKQFSVGKDFNMVAMYGARVELATDGSLIVYTNGTVKVKPAAANDTAVEALKIGMKMKDGTYYAGISPDTKQAMYAAPSDAPLKLNFNKAAEYAQDLEVGGKKGFRVPSLTELNVVRDALLQNEEMKKTFNLTGSDPDGWYWSSSPSDLCASYTRCQCLSDGTQYSVAGRTNGLSVRPVRS